MLSQSSNHGTPELNSWIPLLYFMICQACPHPVLFYVSFDICVCPYRCEWTAHFSIRLRHICHFRNLSGGELWWRTPGVPLRFLSIFWEKNLGVSQGYARGTPEVRHFRQPPASLVAPHTYCTETAQFFSEFGFFYSLLWSGSALDFGYRNEKFFSANE